MSWGGMFIVTVRRLTLRMRSMPKGSRRTRPGPLGFRSTLPRRKITARSYSGSTRPAMATQTIRTTPTSTGAHGHRLLLLMVPALRRGVRPIRYFLVNAQCSPNDTDRPLTDISDVNLGDAQGGAGHVGGPSEQAHPDGSGLSVPTRKRSLATPGLARFPSDHIEHGRRNPQRGGSAHPCNPSRSPALSATTWGASSAPFGLAG